jgi:hypothetical protein
MVHLVYTPALKMEAIHSSKTLTSSYKSTQHDNLDEHNPTYSRLPSTYAGVPIYLQPENITYGIFQTYRIPLFSKNQERSVLNSKKLAKSHKLLLT